MAGDVAGWVSALWRFPFKSRGGEEIADIGIGTGAIVGDGAYALLASETGRTVRAESTRRFAGILDWGARWFTDPTTDQPCPPVRIDLWDGQSVRSDSLACDAPLSHRSGRKVRPVRTSPGMDGFAPPDAHEFEGRLGAAFLAGPGAPAAWAAQGFQDVFALSLVAGASRRHLGSVRPQSVFDVRRFRMNVVVAGPDSGLVENAWVGRTIVGPSGPRLPVAMADARCAMTTLAQGDLSAGPAVLCTIAREDTLACEGLGRQPCLGVCGAVEAGGGLRIDDALRPVP